MFLQSTEKVYSQRCNSVSSSLPSLNITKHHHKQRTTQESEVQDSKSPPLRFLEESCLELKLVPSSHCESVCTLDKVNSALQRAERDHHQPHQPVTLKKMRLALHSLQQEYLLLLALVACYM